MYRSIEQDRPDLVQYITDLGFNDWSMPTYAYAKKGNKELVNYYLSLSKDYQSAANGALDSDHKELVDYIKSLASGI